MTTSTTTLADRARVNIRRLLDLRGMTIAELGRKAMPNIASAEANMRSLISGSREPSLVSLPPIAHALGVDVAALFVDPEAVSVADVEARAQRIHERLRGAGELPWDELFDEERLPYMALALEITVEIEMARHRAVVE